MKKAFIMLSLLGIMFAGFTYAATTKPLTPAQKRIQATKLAKLKAKQVKTNTGVVNTGCIEITTLISNINNLTGSYGTQFDLMSTYISDTSLLYNKYKDGQKCYSEIKVLYSNIESYRTIMKDITKKYLEELGTNIGLLEKLIKTKKEQLSHDTSVYNSCLLENNTIKANNLANGSNNDVKDCGIEPKKYIDNIQSKLDYMNDRFKNLSK